MSNLLVIEYVMATIGIIVNGIGITRLSVMRMRLAGVLREITAKDTADTALASWARDTALTITDKQGVVFSGSLAELYEDQMIDQVWIDPVMVSLWSRTAEMLRQFPGSASRKDPRG